MRPWPGHGLVVELAESGQVDGIVATKIDRVSRSVRDFADLVRRARTNNWALVLLDLGHDLSSPMGEFVAHVLSAVAQLARRMIGERTRDHLAAAKARGVRVGRPPEAGADVDRRRRPRWWPSTLRGSSRESWPRRRAADPRDGPRRHPPRSITRRASSCVR